MFVRHHHVHHHSHRINAAAELRVIEGRTKTFEATANPAIEAGFFILGERMDFTKLDGLIPAVIQDVDSAEVLMVGFMNDEALAITKRTGFATFFSRTRNKLWTKGETSGNRLEVVEMLTDC